MFDTSRSRKRFFVGSTYFVVFILVAWLVYIAGRPAPTCFDGAKNQDETGIDCGGVCGACSPKWDQPKDLSIQETSVVYGGVNIYDALAKVSNPNPEDGVESFEYTFILKDETGATLAERRGRSFILPGETKYIIVTQLASQTVPKKIALEISDVEWKHFVGGYQERPVLNVFAKKYDQIRSGPGFGEATGLVVNDSSFDFANVRVNVILRDKEDKPVALNFTEMQTLKSQEKRDFTLPWPSAFPGEVVRVEAEAEADVYRSDNFVKKYFPNTQF